ncbi:MAG: hypothetical protein ABJN69_11665 [Hellea sp.]
MNLKLTAALSVSLVAFSGIFLGSKAQAQTHANPAVNAAQFLGADYMDSAHHRVAPQAISDGYLLRYEIETPYERMTVLGTEQTKIRISEIQATETLRQRSTGGEILGSAKDRTTNLVETPYRIGKTLVNRAGDISNVGDAVLFVPEQVGQVAGNLLHGVGELAVTGARITSGAAGTKCSGFGCVEKAGSDIWSGVNSLAGKHNASRRLHAEFGTDPQTENKAYRKQIDRLAYANSYTGTTIKLGAGQAGIEYLSPAFTGVGYVNNAEFVGQYEDAHRQKNREKDAYLAWGADPQAVESLYKNNAFTKLNRRRLFRALDIIPDKIFAMQLLQNAAGVSDRSYAESHLAVSDYIAALNARGDISAHISNAVAPLIVSRDGTLILPVYADYLRSTPQLNGALQDLSNRSRQSALHVLGYAGPDVKQSARRLGVQVVEWPGRKL